MCAKNRNKLFIMVLLLNSSLLLFLFSHSVLCDLKDRGLPDFMSFTISCSLLKLMSIELIMISNHLILYHPLLLLPSVFPSIRAFPMSQFFPSGGQSIGASASASVLPMIIQGWLPLGLTGLISLLSKGLSRYSVLHFLFPLKIVLKIDSSASVFFLQIPQSFVLSFFLDS